MKWTPGTENDDVIDQRGDSGGGGYSGGGGGGGFGMMHLGGGGLAVVAIVVVARLFGVDITGLLGHHGGTSSNYSQSSGPRDDRQRPPVGPDQQKEMVGFVKFVLTDIQTTFEKKLNEAHRPYRHAKLVLFRDNTNTACGPSSKEIGPFYCPGDEHAYIDLTFYDELRTRFGSPGNFAQAYVLAHELGHHLQKLFGTEQRASRLSGGSRNDTSVRVELQADCYAGVWGHDAQTRKLLEPGDIEGALTAAAAIGDDRLQKQAGRTVNPESFTHGTSAQRDRWFRKGFDAGTFDACDTFSAASSHDL